MNTQYIYVVTEDGFKARFIPIIDNGCYYLPSTLKKLLIKLSDVSFSVSFDTAKITIHKHKHAELKALFGVSDLTLFAELEALGGDRNV